jgi:hypothetical protein
MSGMFINVLVAILFAVVAIATILIVFGVAGNVAHYIFVAYRRSKVQGVLLAIVCVLLLVGVVFAVQFAKPYVVEMYGQITG